MLKSQEIKQEIIDLRAKIQTMVDAKQDVPNADAEMLNKLLSDYESVKTAEEAEKNNKIKPIVKGENKVDKKICNQVVKALLAKKEIDKELVAQSGIQGIVDAVGTVGNVEAVGTRGGYLVPDEYLELDKFGGEMVDIPSRTIPVSLPEGYMPNVDLSQAKDGKFLAKHDELDTIGKNNPVFGRLEYKCETYQGIVPVSMDLMEDTSDILPVVAECFDLTSRAQRNAVILDKLETEATASQTKMQTVGIGTGKTFADKEAIKAIRSVILSKLSGVNRSKAQIVVCDTTFGKLAMIEDADGHPYLCPDVTNPSIYRIEGHEVIAIDDLFMTSANTLTEVAWVGNFDRVAVFNRKGLELSSDSSNMFDMDALAVKGKKRFDVRVLEQKAFVKIKTGA